MVRNGDMFGDGVKIAVRMEKSAQPRLVCVLGAAYDYVPKVLPLPFDDLGTQIVKNLDAPMRDHWPIRLIIRCLGRCHRLTRRSEFNLAQRFHAILNRALVDVAKPEGQKLVKPAVIASLHDAPHIDERRLAERIGANLASAQRMV